MACGVIGRTIVTLVPRPTVLASERCPPISPRKCFTEGRPRPMPCPSGLVVKNGSVTWSRIAAGMPSPDRAEWWAASPTGSADIRFGHATGFTSSTSRSFRPGRRTQTEVDRPFSPSLRCEPEASVLGRRAGSTRRNQPNQPSLRLKFVPFAPHPIPRFAPIDLSLKGRGIHRHFLNINSPRIRHTNEKLHVPLGHMEFWFCFNH